MAISDSVEVNLLERLGLDLFNSNGFVVAFIVFFLITLATFLWGVTYMLEGWGGGRQLPHKWCRYCGAQVQIGKEFSSSIFLPVLAGGYLVAILYSNQATDLAGTLLALAFAPIPAFVYISYVDLMKDYKCTLCEGQNFVDPNGGGVPPSQRTGSSQQPANSSRSRGQHPSHHQGQTEQHPGTPQQPGNSPHAHPQNPSHLGGSGTPTNQPREDRSSGSTHDQ